MMKATRPERVSLLNGPVCPRDTKQTRIKCVRDGGRSRLRYRNEAYLEQSGTGPGECLVWPLLLLKLTNTTPLWRDALSAELFNPQPCSGQTALSTSRTATVPLCVQLGLHRWGALSSPWLSPMSSQL
ncbi:hypothetical protein SRHO_G00034990 [Serrasalmus rhombeus]